jgi:hypothetical protein
VLIEHITAVPRQKVAPRRKVALLAEQLAGPKPTPLVKLLASRVALCWLDVHFADVHCLAMIGLTTLASSDEDYSERRQNWAHRRFLSACRTLAVCQRLTVPVAQERLDAALGKPAT